MKSKGWCKEHLIRITRQSLLRARFIHLPVSNLNVVTASVATEGDGLQARFRFEFPDGVNGGLFAESPQKEHVVSSLGAAAVLLQLEAKDEGSLVDRNVGNAAGRMHLSTHPSAGRKLDGGAIEIFFAKVQLHRVTVAIVEVDVAVMRDR